MVKSWSTQTWETVVNEIQETGYSGTELGDWGFMPTDPQVLSRELQSRGLSMVGSRVVVEQDVLPGMGQPRESARRNREFLKGIGL